MTNTPTLDLWALLPCTTAHLGPLSQWERTVAPSPPGRGWGEGSPFSLLCHPEARRAEESHRPWSAPGGRASHLQGQCGARAPRGLSLGLRLRALVASTGPAGPSVILRPEGPKNLITSAAPLLLNPLSPWERVG